MPLLMLRARTLVLSATKALGRIFPLPTDLVVARRNEQSLMPYRRSVDAQSA